jgi:hypothetical protein
VTEWGKAGVELYIRDFSSIRLNRGQPATANGTYDSVQPLVVRADVFPHLVMPVGPFVSALRGPVIEMMWNPPAG